MKTQYYTATSLDGFIATEDDSLEWLFSLGDLSASSYPEFISNVGALAMGSATYQWMLRNAEIVAAETGSAWPYTQPAWIFTSRQLPPIEGANIRFFNGDVRLPMPKCGLLLATKTSGSLEAVTSPVNSTTLDCWMNCSCRSVRSPSAKVNPFSPAESWAQFSDWCLSVRTASAWPSCITKCTKMARAVPANSLFYRPVLSAC